MMNEQQVIELLDKLAEIKMMADALNFERQAKINAMLPTIPPEISKAIDDINVEYNSKTVPATDQAAKIEKLVIDAVLALGESVKGSQLHAVWSKGRVTWDTSKLDGLMIAVPQLKELRKEGKPSVGIRAAKG